MMRFCFSIFCSLSITVSLSAQSYHFQQYSVGEGLPQSQVYALHQDIKGYLWLGTQGGGLARFDGKNFTTFTEQDGLAGNAINAITEDGDGQLWIGSYGGISRYDGTGFKAFKPANRQNIAIQDLAIAPDGQLWAAAENGIYFLENDSVLQKEKKSNIAFGRMYAALTDSQGRLWMGGEKGIFQYSKTTGKWQKAWADNTEVLDLAETANGEIWAAAYNYGLVKLDGKNWRKDNFPELPSETLQCLWPAPDGSLWVGTQNAGIFIYETSQTSKISALERSGNPELASGQHSALSTLNSSDGLCNNNVKTISGDRWGTVWMGTSGSGACKYGGQEFEHLTTKDGLKSDFVYALANDTSGGLWLSAGDRGISFFHKNEFTHFGQDSGFIDLKCRAIHQDGAGQTWIGTEGAGMATFHFTNDSIPQRKFLFLRKGEGLPSKNIKDITSNTANEIWVAMINGGISKITYNDVASGSFFYKNFGIAEGLSDPNVHALHFDNWGRLWFGTQRRGIGMIFKDHVKMLGPEAKLPGGLVRCLAEDGQGYLWCGTDSRGIGRAAIYGDTLPVFTFFSKKEGLASPNIYLLQFDESGHLWAGSNRGVDRLKLDASRNIVEVKHFGYAEGFRGVETCQNASLVDEEGSLWFGTINGLMRYRPLLDTGKVVKPQVHFKSINLFYEPLSASAFRQFFDKKQGIAKGAVFPHDQNHLGFEFFAPNFPNPDKTSYAWQMVGSEGDWSPYSTRSEVSYSNLPPGDYTFRVRAKNEKEVVGDVLETSFTIEPPFWETWWFRITAASALVLVVGGFFWLRIRQVRKKAAQEKAKLEMQNHLLQLEQKARQLQMNPHFIFNALNSIQSLVMRKDFDGSRAYILKFGKLMRAVLDNSRKESIPLEKEMDTLQKYLEMEQFCRDGNFDFTINADGLENDDLQIPPMLLQPFVENAILHGVAPLKDRRGLIEIVFSEKGNRLQVEIKDNGVGINKSPEVGSEEKKRSSAGIAVTRERLGILNGSCKLLAGKENGTEVIVTIPV